MILVEQMEDQARWRDVNWRGKYCVSVGRSMEPTLFGQELLEVVTFDGGAPVVGDVVLYHPLDGGEMVVHRVVRVERDGTIRTRGDNNSAEDLFALAAGDIVGRVVAAWRGQRKYAIHGGLAGRLVGAWRRFVRTLIRRGGLLLRPIYRALARTGIMARLAPARWRARVVTVQLDGHPLRRVLVGGRIAGYYDTRRRRWQIRYPYRLLVEEGRLPGTPVE